MCPQHTHPYKVVPSVETACALNTLIPTRLCHQWRQHVPSTHSSLQGGAVHGDNMCPQNTHPYKVVPSVETTCALKTLIPTRLCHLWRQHVPSTHSSLQGGVVRGDSMCLQHTHSYKVVPSVETACALNTLIPTRLCHLWRQHVPSTHSFLQGGAVCGDSMCPQNTHPYKVVPSVETACALNTLIPTRWCSPWRQHVPSTHSFLQGGAVCGDSICPQHTHPYKVVPSVETACALNTLIPTRWCRLWRQHVPSKHSSLQGCAICGDSMCPQHTHPYKVV